LEKLAVYVLGVYAEANPARLHEFIDQHSFGLLVSTSMDGPFATHLPFLLDRHAGPHGTLIGHMARANPQWQHAADQSVLAIFSGPHAYVSPTWYEAEQVVPTWNYVAVHAYGRLRLIDDAAGKLDILLQTVEAYERSMPQPWILDEADPHLPRLLAQIVGFRIDIERLEGKWKLNQNHPADRRAKVVRALQERGGEDALAIAALMVEMLPEELRR
jgi:transcriptional regulator